MSLKIEMDSYDYEAAILAVQKLLDDIDTKQDHEADPIKIINMPSATQIVDLVWDLIR